MRPTPGSTWANPRLLKKPRTKLRTCDIEIFLKKIETIGVILLSQLFITWTIVSKSVVEIVFLFKTTVGLFVAHVLEQRHHHILILLGGEVES